MVCEKTHSCQLPARLTVCCRANSSVIVADQQVPVPLGSRAALTKTVLTSYSKVRLDVDKLQLISKHLLLYRSAVNRHQDTRTSLQSKPQSLVQCA